MKNKQVKIRNFWKQKINNKKIKFKYKIKSALNSMKIILKQFK